MSKIAYQGEIGRYADNAYLEKTEEKQLGISLVKLSAKSSHLTDVQDMVNRIAHEVGDVTPPQVFLPERGVLPSVLAPESRKQINAALGTEYAKRNERERKSMSEMVIEERGDSMKSLAKECDAYGAKYTLTTRPFESVCGSYANEERIYWLRAGVASKVATAFKALNPVGLKGHVYDCFRPEEVQATLFLRRLMNIARNEREWDEKAVLLSAQSLTASAPGVAGHQSGAAIDWRLSNVSGHWKPDLGNTYPEGGAVSSIDFPYVTYDQWKTRTLFASLNKMVGLRMLRTEDWHSSYGDRGMGIDGATHSAFYGPIRSFNLESGEIEEKYNADEIDMPYVSRGEAFEAIRMARSNKSFADVVTHLHSNRHGTKQKRAENWIPQE